MSSDGHDLADDYESGDPRICPISLQMLEDSHVFSSGLVVRGETAKTVRSFGTACHRHQ